MKESLTFKDRELTVTHTHTQDFPPHVFVSIRGLFVSLRTLRSVFLSEFRAFKDLRGSLQITHCCRMKTLYHQNVKELKISMCNNELGL